MGLGSLFKTTTTIRAPLDGSSTFRESAPAGATMEVSDFVTVQSFSNFALMTGAITAAWKALERLNPRVFSALWVPYAFAAVFALISLLISTDAMKKASGGVDGGKVLASIFIAVINALVLASAVVGASVATTALPDADT